MTTWLTKYEPMMKVTTFSGKEYYFPKRNLEAFQQSIETKKFISLQGSTVNVSSIDTVDPAGQNNDFVENMLRELPTDTQHEIRQEIKLRATKIHTPLTEWVVQNMIDKYKWL